MIRLRPAHQSDSAAIAACVCEAYVHYVERIGKQPGPMLEDYAVVILDSLVHVAVDEDSGRVIGAIVMQETPEGFYIDNVAVRPSVKGQGVGRALLQFADGKARRRGNRSIYLATHELMVENRALYEKAGYRQYGQRVVNGYPRVFLQKELRAG
jgi:ribosomal protein S18 acetylase RimI-like enzyme